MKAIIMGAQAIQVGYRRIVVAVGSESMSNAPFYVPRGEIPFGGVQLVVSFSFKKSHFCDYFNRMERSSTIKILRCVCVSLAVLTTSFLFLRFIVINDMFVGSMLECKYFLSARRFHWDTDLWLYSRSRLGVWDSYPSWNLIFWGSERSFQNWKNERRARYEASRDNPPGTGCWVSWNREIYLFTAFNE